jgi:hypothetical protein
MSLFVCVPPIEPAAVMRFTTGLHSANGNKKLIVSKATAMRSNLGAAKAPTTWAAYEPHWHRYMEFRHGLGLDSEASNTKIAALFLNDMWMSAMERIIGPQAVTQASAALTAYFESNTQPSPCTHDVV